MRKVSTIWKKDWNSLRELKNSFREHFSELSGLFVENEQPAFNDVGYVLPEAKSPSFWPSQLDAPTLSQRTLGLLVTVDRILWSTALIGLPQL